MLMLTDGNIDNASARIRAIQYIPYFEKVGYSVHHIPRISRIPSGLIGKYTIFPLQKRWYFLKMVVAIVCGRWDMVYIQRIFISKYLLKILNKKVITIIYDFDDAIYISQKRPVIREKVANMVRHATSVIVSTEYLKPFCLLNGKTAEVIPSPVETDRIRASHKSIDHGQPVTIGWIGSPWTTQFLELVEKPLQMLAKKYRIRFLTVGAKPEYSLSGTDHTNKMWHFGDENEDLGRMDIGIMPLPDNEWTRMKGGYKLLQYLSAGIPCVASPVGINQSIIKPGENGYLAATEEEWYLFLEGLINDPELRSRLGSCGRRDAVELYSREICFKKLEKLLLK